MDPWQRSIRRMHQVGEFLDLDPEKSNMVADFVSLIEAMREGLTHIDDESYIPDSQINLLFLTKLKARPEWNGWATAMLRDNRINTSNPAEQITFQELADLAIEQEKNRQRPGRSAWGPSRADFSPPHTIPHTTAPEEPRTLTQDEINAFVVQQMSQDRKLDNRRARGHAKRPSQEEINDYVVEQMRREYERTTRDRSYSQPMPSQPLQRPVQMRCTFCGDKHHQLQNCWRRWRVAVEAPHGDYLPKRVEYRSEIPGQPPTYHSGFTLY
ncbi:hypothetical protein BO70DRAFT_363827 [Aspergillus heteromorphus CBS 117.55]|uniref:Uncharacterized protein n=1 Tax=Aspergillus heteromorphus CBS 117.55 TaxID=1448321 RepID=A0A317VTR7_9EURO|nr:uncharacterized protein BO70DRAFT_363827 [Aspergillus heteromorphus CBS 117.55]PWY76248.1 hypothetical protein BO70DRAFT_363827 [Aspergillus heteromorphus CBS 117.55]